MIGLIALASAGMVLQDAPSAVPTLSPPHYRTYPQIEPFMPEAAKTHAVSGQATLTCLVTTAGALRSCEIVEERPMGWGFGQAALSAAGAVQMWPATADGVPIETTARIAIQFQNTDACPVVEGQSRCKPQ